MALTDNLVAYWKFDESSGNAADSIGSNTLTNANVTYTTGKINNGATFTDNTTHLRNAGTGFVYTTFTISAWLNPTTLATRDQAYFYSDGGAHNLELRIDKTTGKPYILQAGEAGIGQATSGIAAGVWSHVVCTYDTSGNWAIYINGVSAGSGTNLKTLSNGTINLGSVAGGAEYLTGMIDEVGYWSRVLSADEVSHIYNYNVGIQYPFITFIANSFRRLYQAVIRASSY